MAEERRDLVGLKATSTAGVPITVPKGGLPRGERLWVPALYRGGRVDVVVDPGAEELEIVEALVREADEFDARAAEAKAEAQAEVEVTFLALKKAYADLGTAKTTEAAVKAQVAEAMGKTAAVAGVS